ncbi:Putative sugar phosphate isomerase YwlF [Bacillus amyloliquefaciens]|nr:Putative sugar phosphate isomerase YwlF [Bacillus amyloliquefaciens]
MKVAIASDHGGVHIREEIKSLLDELQIEYIDMAVNAAPALSIIQTTLFR